MWLLPTSISSAFAAEQVCSTSPLRRRLRSLEFEPAFWLTLSGKAVRRPLSWHGWKNRRWSQRLFGAVIWNRSLANSTVAAWLEALPGSPVRPSALPGKGSGWKTPDGSCPPSSTAFARLGANGCFWRTCADSFLPMMEPPSEKFSGSWPSAGLLRNGCVWQLPTWAPDMSGSGCSSWPTPRLNTGPSKDDRHLSIDAAAQLWPSPAARDFRGENEQPSHLSQLPNFLRHLWPTPKSGDGDKGGLNQAGSKGDLTLPSASSHWKTPRANEANAGTWHNNPDGSTGLTLNGEVQLWATPNVPNGGRKLTAEQVKAKGKTPKGKRQVGLENQVAFSDSLPPAQTPTGEASSPAIPTSRRQLNPAFVCWLMGWPWYWTNPEPISFASEATALWRSRLRALLCSYCGGSDYERA